VAGEHDLSRIDGTEQVKSVRQVISHEDYQPFIINNDMCLLRLSSPLNLNR
jgi:hypothetical protein